MLETIAIILIVLWLLGMVTSYTVGGFIHILLVIAIIMLLVRIITGRRVPYTRTRLLRQSPCLRGCAIGPFSSPLPIATSFGPLSLAVVDPLEQLWRHHAVRI